MSVDAPEIPIPVPEEQAQALEKNKLADQSKWYKKGAFGAAVVGLAAIAGGLLIRNHRDQLRHDEALRSQELDRNSKQEKVINDEVELNRRVRWYVSERSPMFNQILVSAKGDKQASAEELRARQNDFELSLKYASELHMSDDEAKFWFALGRLVPMTKIATDQGRDFGFKHGYPMEQLNDPARLQALYLTWVVNNFPADRGIQYMVYVLGSGDGEKILKDWGAKNPGQQPTLDGILPSESFKEQIKDAKKSGEIHNGFVTAAGFASSLETPN